MTSAIWYGMTSTMGVMLPFRSQLPNTVNIKGLCEPLITSTTFPVPLLPEFMIHCAIIAPQHILCQCNKVLQLFWLHFIYYTLGTDCAFFITFNINYWFSPSWFSEENSLPLFDHIWKKNYKNQSTFFSLNDNLILKLIPHIFQSWKV